MSNLALARAIAFSVLAGTVSAALIFIISVVGSFPRVWPGTVIAFLLVSTTTFLNVTPRRR